MRVSLKTRSMNSSQFWARRQASVATLRTRVTPRRSIFPAHTRKARIVRWIAASLSTPVSLTRSPRRTIRENASMTRNPSRSFSDLATSNRQLLVPRSSAAKVCAWRPARNRLFRREPRAPSSTREAGDSLQSLPIRAPALPRGAPVAIFPNLLSCYSKGVRRTRARTSTCLQAVPAVGSVDAMLTVSNQ